MASGKIAPIAGRWGTQEDLTIVENTNEAQPLEPNSSAGRTNDWTYSATAEDNGTVGALDGQPGLVFNGPNETVVTVGFADFDMTEGTIAGEATDEIDMALYINSTETTESDEGDSEHSVGGTVEFNLADTDVSLENGDVVRFVVQMAASNEDDADYDILNSVGSWSVRQANQGSIPVSVGEAHGGLYFSSASATTIAAATTAVKAAGTTAALGDGASSDLTIATTNRLTWDGATRRFLVEFSGDLSHAGIEGETQRCTAQLFRDGSLVTGLETSVDVEANGRGACSFSGIVQLRPGQYIEVWVSNEEAATNVTVQSGLLSITAL